MASPVWSADSIIDIQLHDTYFVIPTFFVAIPFIATLLGAALAYFITYFKFRLNSYLTLAHILLTGLPVFVLILLIPVVWLDTSDLRHYAFTQFIDNQILPYAEWTVLTVSSIVVFFLAQVILVINLFRSRRVLN